MQSPRVLAMLLILLAAALTGCAESGTDGTSAGDTDASGDNPPATSTGGESPGSGAADGTGGGDGAANGDDSASADDGVADWYAFAFDREVTTASGDTGRISTFTFENTLEQDGGRQVVRVRVAHEGTVTEPVRTQKFDFGSGSYEPEVVSTTVSMHKLRHEIEVVEDTTGERAAGDTATVTVYLPTGEVGGSGAFAWFFTKLAFQTPDGQGTWEYHLTPEMEEEMNSGSGVSYLPFTEDEDASSWWGFEFMATTYGLGFFAGYATGDQTFEEGSFNYGGMSHVVERRTFEIGAHAFDGWSVETTSTYGGASSSNTMKVAPGLPIPVAYAISSQEGEDTYLVSYELLDIVLE